MGLKTTAMQVKIIAKYESVFNQNYTLEDDCREAQLEQNSK
jgi:hypothetical protein